MQLRCNDLHLRGYIFQVETRHSGLHLDLCLAPCKLIAPHSLRGFHDFSFQASDIDDACKQRTSNSPSPDIYTADSFVGSSLYVGGEKRMASPSHCGFHPAANHERLVFGRGILCNVLRGQKRKQRSARARRGTPKPDRQGQAKGQSSHQFSASQELAVNGPAPAPCRSLVLLLLLFYTAKLSESG